MKARGLGEGGCKICVNKGVRAAQAWAFSEAALPFALVWGERTANKGVMERGAERIGGGVRRTAGARATLGVYSELGVNG